jgi:hypothetical protein
MAMDLFGKLGDLGNNIGGAIGGLVDELSKTSGIGSQNDGKILAAQQEIADLTKRETEIFAEIGRQAFAANPSGYAQGENLRLLQADIVAAEARLSSLHEEQEKARHSQGNANPAICCPSCGQQNHEGVKLCQGCGAKLAKAFCVSCGAELAPGVRFCGACGAKQTE